MTQAVRKSATVPPGGASEQNGRSDAVDFYSLSQEGLFALLKERFNLPAFRAKQLFTWVYKKRMTDITRMSDIGADLRATLSSLFTFEPLKIRERKVSSDGSRKYLFECSDGDMIEAVMIKQPKRMTLCISSQVGCAMGCGFCRTATMGLKRNLSVSEIVRQVTGVIDDSVEFGDSFQNIVFMGMGEPLHNLEAVLGAVSILGNSNGLGISGKRITVSTSGLVPALKKLGESGVEVNLAVSLNATSDETRSKIMPVNRSYSLEKLMAALHEFPLKKRKRITIEYVLIKGINDSREDLKRLPRLLHGIRCKVNLIPYNPSAGLEYDAPEKETLTRWQDALLKSGIETTIRWSKGQDISAACGQLASESGKRRSQLE